MDRTDPKFTAICKEITAAFLELLKVAGDIRDELDKPGGQALLGTAIRDALFPAFEAIERSINTNVDQALEIGAAALSLFPSIKGAEAADLIRTLKTDEAYYKAEADARFERRRLADSDLN